MNKELSSRNFWKGFWPLRRDVKNIDNILSTNLSPCSDQVKKLFLR
ncbi:hypothetical protein N499_0534 [Wolbachia pipientis wVitA]|nr:hypothetical protein N499_0534 [Wolbachia pipientis wVitA]